MIQNDLITRAHIDAMTIEADYREEVGQLCDEMDLLGSEDLSYAGVSLNRMVALADKHGTNLEAYLDNVADLRERIMHARPLPEVKR